MTNSVANAVFLIFFLTLLISDNQKQCLLGLTPGDIM